MRIRIDDRPRTPPPSREKRSLRPFGSNGSGGLTKERLDEFEAAYLLHQASLVFFEEEGGEGSTSASGKDAAEVTGVPGADIDMMNDLCEKYWVKSKADKLFNLMLSS